MAGLTGFITSNREQAELLLRLCVAALCGMTVGLNRDLQGKPIGMRTLGLVSLSAAMVVLSGAAFGGLHYSQDALSRVIQGVLTGIGFLGAGVIIHRQDPVGVQGLTTASTVWIAAALGVTAGLGAWFITIAGNTIALALLIFGKPLERAINARMANRRRGSEGPAQADDGHSGH